MPISLTALGPPSASEIAVVGFSGSDPVTQPSLSSGRIV